MAFISIGKELARLGDAVTLIGSGEADPTTPYRFLHAASVPRERFEAFPFGPVLRHEFAYEELTFVPDCCVNFDRRITTLPSLAAILLPIGRCAVPFFEGRGRRTFS